MSINKSWERLHFRRRLFLSSPSNSFNILSLVPMAIIFPSLTAIASATEKASSAVYIFAWCTTKGTFLPELTGGKGVK